MQSLETEKKEPLKASKLMKRMFNVEESVFYAINGRRGSGKTDFALRIYEYLTETNSFSKYATNISIKDRPQNLEFINDYETLQNWAYADRTRKLYILDEAGRVMQRRRPMSTINVKLLNDLQILRKARLSYIWVTPSRDYLDSSINEDQLTGIIYKYSKPKARLIMLYGNYNPCRLYGIQRTTLKFQSYDTADFYMLPLRDKRKAKEPFELRMKKYLELIHSGQKPTIEQAFGSRSQYKRQVIKYFENVLDFDKT